MQTPSFTCSKCGEAKPLSDFPPSKARNSAQWCRLCLRESARKRIGAVEREVVCGCCNKAFRSAFGKAKYCSRSCKETARRQAERQDREQSKPTNRKCIHCGDVMPQSMRSDAVFCSARCNSAAHQATRKASWKIGVRQERVSRAYIVERDRGRCHMCGKRCRAGEIHLDHVIPLARGGSHSPANVRVSCASCNLSKRDRARGEQLLLVG